MRKSIAKYPPDRTICIRLAKKQLKKILKTRNDIIAAYSDGSLARDDMVVGSDIDIGVIVENRDEPWHVWRIIDNDYDILIEWAFISRLEYEDIKKILENAGFTHDIANAYIYYDPEGFFGDVQNEVLKRYKEKGSIIRRAGNQLKAVKKSIRDIENSIKVKDRKTIYRNLSSAIKYSLGLPSAILNRPLTNARGIVFCKRSCAELNILEYANLVLEFIGAKRLIKKDAKIILSNVKKILKSEKLNNNDRSTYLYHLRSGQYLIDTGLWREATWPILMWSTGIVIDLSQRKGSDTIPVKKLWHEMHKILGWYEWTDITGKLKIGKKLIKLGSTILEQHGV